MNEYNYQKFSYISQAEVGNYLATKMALIYVCSQSNKTFILNELDFLFLTDTWLKLGENGQIVELCQ